jgi:hypothetical protein
MLHWYYYLKKKKKEDSQVTGSTKWEQPKTPSILGWLGCEFFFFIWYKDSSLSQSLCLDRAVRSIVFCF